MPIDRQQVLNLLRQFDFGAIFTRHLGWDGGHNRAWNTRDVANYRFRPIAESGGVVVFEVEGADIPDASERAAIHQAISRLAHENLLVFADTARSRSLWYWVKREGAKALPRSHSFVKGQPGDLFLSKLDGLLLEISDYRPDGSVPLHVVQQRLSGALDVERVTKRFYTEFSDLRLDFVDAIQGIPRQADRAWYASVLLNRLMFVYFLQKRGFIQANTRYLDDKLKESAAGGPDRFFRHFLRTLFFEGFAKPEAERSAETSALLGPLHYLNGGLFLPHHLETAYPDIQVPDSAFQRTLALFGRYSWHLDDTPGGQDNQINPDVLGYIFEKYINQKAFGAYYTRTEITEYLCERTIHAVILEKLNVPAVGGGPPPPPPPPPPVHLDAHLCRELLTILPSISILDPACGSGAFLIAAMKTLVNIYAAVFGKIEFLNDTNLSTRLATVRRDHPSVNYYIRKSIITDNLFGVDIMDEAVEIAKLRLFLGLVAAAERVDHLEPLPNIDFNILAGNSLIGLLSVAPEKFDARRGMAGLFDPLAAKDYQALLAEKDRLVASYRHAASYTDDLSALRTTIEHQRAFAQERLDSLLLEEFQALNIRYEAAQADGKAKKRPLVVGDIRALEPFHWGYEFDQILEGDGGFDVIITNPPWETFKPQAKEFFAEFSDLVTKNTMTIKEFEKEQARLMRDSAVAEAWADYQSRFPHVSAYYRSSAQYPHQVAMVDGKRAGTDINLYKLFLERCFSLLRQGGHCGIVIPSGIYTDLGAKALREMLFERTQLSGLFGFENRKEIFEGVDSRFKFVVLTFAKGGSTREFPVAFMRHEVAELSRFPSHGALPMTVAAVRAASPGSLSIPEYRRAEDVAIAAKLARFPLLGAAVPNSWTLRLTCEFHMTNDSHLFHQQPGPGRLPLYEGKMIHQYTHQWGPGKYWVDEAEGRKALLGRRPDTGQRLDYQTYRLAFRDVARNTDERTMIMTMLPPALFCNHPLPGAYLEGIEESRSALSLAQLTLMNSFIVDYSLRYQVTAHVLFHLVYNTHVPRLCPGDRWFAPLLARAAKLICTTPEYDDLAREVGLNDHRAGVTDPTERAQLRAEIDGMVAHVYELSEAEFAYILSTFPLVKDEVKQAALAAYRAVAAGRLP